MNLDDFSYEENGRRYIDPNVSLNEQNDFIQKLRDTQGQRNAQIAQQTHNLGTDVPSNLGGLNGSEAYFNARYQTPQTNNLVGELKSAAQAQALQTALNNELSKAQKRYNDAYRAAAARSNGTSGNNSNDDSGLNVNTNGDQDKKNYYNEGKEPVGDIWFNGTKSTYNTGLGKTYILDNVPDNVANMAPFIQDITNNGPLPTSGTVKEYGGSKYLFLNTKNSQGPRWYQIIREF